MHLARLKLTNFKNYEQQELELSPRLNCFVGLNGMGKTNLLDAVHLLCLCKSHTGLPDRNLLRRGESFYRVEGDFVVPAGRDRVAAKFALGQRKVMERNGTAYPRLADYVGLYPAVMIAPDDVTLVQEGSEERRRFMDTTLSQTSPEYLQNLLLYNGIVQQRNALLKLFADGKPFDGALLEILNRQMLAPAAVLYAQRAAFVQEFRPLFRALYAEIAGAAAESVDVQYASDREQDSLDNLLARALDKDRALQRTTAGPHRDDLLFTLDEQPIKRFASQGQLKSFLLALRLAQYEWLRREKGTAPLLLLDDIFDKLDARRVRQLIGLILGRDYGQIFLTDTHRERIEAIVGEFGGEYRVVEVVEGKVG